MQRYHTMADDRDVLRAVWEGRVPAAFTLSPFEVETLTAPPSFYLMLPRQSYITVCTEKVGPTTDLQYSWKCRHWVLQLISCRRLGSVHGGHP